MRLLFPTSFNSGPKYGKNVAKTLLSGNSQIRSSRLFEQVGTGVGDPDLDSHGAELVLTEVVLLCLRNFPLDLI